MATLAAHDQENAVRNLTIGPGGKPIHAGAKAFGSKTPGNKAPKTPFKVPLNDENVTKQAGKANGKGNENLLMTSKKGGKLDSNAFVTPAGPRNRAPLGMKTTNAKAQGFQTPAPLTAKTQKVSPRLHRPKVKIHQPEPESDSEDDIPEVEYMPPKMVPLKDDMDDYLPRDWNFPKFTHNEMVTGMWNAYHNPITDDGRPKLLREFEEGLERDQKKAREDFDKIMAEEAAKDEAEMKRYFGVEDPKKKTIEKKAAAVPKKTIPAVSTLRARSAAAALSSSATPSYAAPTAATKSRVPTGVVSSKKTIKPLADRPTSRQAAAVAASKSTIGYAQGRAGRAAPAARKPLSNVTKPAPFSSTARRPASSAATTRAAPSTVRGRSGFTRSVSTASDATLVDGPEEEPYRTADEMERDFEIMLQIQGDDDDDEEAWANSFNSQLQGDFLEDDLAEFQFKIPEGL